MKQMAWYFDASSCIGCKTCEMACKDTHDLPVGVRLRLVREYGGGHWAVQDGFEQPVGIFTYYLSTSCMHCDGTPVRGRLPRRGHDQAARGWHRLHRLGEVHRLWVLPVGLSVRGAPAQPRQPG